MKQLNFNIPFSGFESTNFINCFTSVYMYLEGMKDNNFTIKTTFCNEWENGQCDSCGNCKTKPHAVQERFFFLFDTMCGRSALRNHFDGTHSRAGRMIHYGETSDGVTDNNVEFLFGFAGYDYRTVLDKASYNEEITTSIAEKKPVIAKLKSNSNVSCAVISGIDGDRLIFPDFRAAQKAPDPNTTYNDIDALFIIGNKCEPKYKLIDGLKRIEHVMSLNLNENIWDEYCKKIGTYGPDSLGEDNPEGRERRMNRLAGEMWHTFNCHNFAEVFRQYLPGSANKDVYDSVNNVNRLASPEISEEINTISWRYGYTHDLAWSVIGLDECINWEDWKSHYYGDMLEVIILKFKENDEAVLECIKNIIRKL